MRIRLVTWVTEDAAGVTLSLVIQPRAGRTAVAGEHGDALKIRLAAPPVDGAANEALVNLLSDSLGVSKSAISIQSGHTGRRKRARIDGVTATQARSLLPRE